jgi:hypothetical protein
MAGWSFLSNHARALLCIARDPAVRLRELAASLGMTERSAHGIVAERTGGDGGDAGYVPCLAHICGPPDSRIGALSQSAMSV